MVAAVANAADRARSLGDPVLRQHANSAMRKLAFDLPVDAPRGPDESHVALRGRQPDAATFELLTDALSIANSCGSSTTASAATS